MTVPDNNELLSKIVGYLRGVQSNVSDLQKLVDKTTEKLENHMNETQSLRYIVTDRMSSQLNDLTTNYKDLKEQIAKLDQFATNLQSKAAGMSAIVDKYDQTKTDVMNITHEVDILKRDISAISASVTELKATTDTLLEDSASSKSKLDLLYHTKNVIFGAAAVIAGIITFLIMIKDYLKLSP